MSGSWKFNGPYIAGVEHSYALLDGIRAPPLGHIQSYIFITKPKAESGNYQRERPMLHMLKLKSPENAR